MGSAEGSDDGIRDGRYVGDADGIELGNKLG